MDFKTIEEYLKLLFKNGTAELLYFFLGLIALSYLNPELFPFQILVILIVIGVIFSFAAIMIRTGFALWRFMVLYIAETKDKVEKKQWEITSLQDQVTTIAENVITKILPTKKEELLEETYFKKAEEGEKFTKEEVELDSLKQLSNGISATQPDLKAKIADLEQKIADLEK